MDIKDLIRDIFTAHEIDEVSISSLPDIIDEIADLMERVADATGDAIADNLSFDQAEAIGRDGTQRTASHVDIMNLPIFK